MPDDESRPRRYRTSDIMDALTDMPGRIAQAVIDAMPKPEQKPEEEEHEESHEEEHTEEATGPDGATAAEVTFVPEELPVTPQAPESAETGAGAQAAATSTAAPVPPRRRGFPRRGRNR